MVSRDGHTCPGRRYAAPDHVLTPVQQPEMQFTVLFAEGVGRQPRGGSHVRSVCLDLLWSHVQQLGCLGQTLGLVRLSAHTELNDQFDVK